MENASKALLIAGGVLLAILILSLLILTITKISDFNKSKEESLETEQILKFNSEYEAYNKKSLHGTEVITVWNKATDNNNKQDSNARTYKVIVSITLDKEPTASLKKGIKIAALSKSSGASQESLPIIGKISAGAKIGGGSPKLQPWTITNEGDNIESNLETIKGKTFYCSQIEYDESGRLIAINFHEGQSYTGAFIIYPNSKPESTIRDSDMATESTIRGSDIPIE